MVFSTVKLARQLGSAVRQKYKQRLNTDPTRTERRTMLDVFQHILATRRVIDAWRVGILTWPSWARWKRTGEEHAEPLRAAHKTLSLPMQSGPKSPELPRNARESLLKPSLLDPGAARERSESWFDYF